MVLLIPHIIQIYDILPGVGALRPGFQHADAMFMRRLTVCLGLSFRVLV